MGAFKPLLTIDGQPLIRLTVTSALLGGASSVCVVLGREAERVRAVLVDLPGVFFVENPRFANSDMLTSVQRGLRALLDAGHKSGRGPKGGASFMSRKDSEEPIPLCPTEPPPDAIFILPGDMPAIKPETFRLLAERATSSAAAILYPQFDGRRGHPLFLRREAFAAVLEFCGDGGVKAAVADFAAETVASTDVGILLDIDTPEAYARMPGSHR
jgi:CTP:molybdopterin cytidylyltransferase MocA